MVKENECRHEQSLKYAINVLTKDYWEYVHCIYLYGSYARKDHKYNSDVDLFVCVSENTTARVAAHMRSDVVPDDYNLPIVELMISKSGLRNPSPQFMRNLERDAILLWKK